MISSPFDKWSDARYSCWRSAGSAHVRLGPLDWPAVAPSIKSRDVDCAPSPHHERRRFNAKRAERPLQPNLLTPAAAAKSP